MVEGNAMFVSTFEGEVGSYMSMSVHITAANIIVMIVSVHMRDKNSL